MPLPPDGRHGSTSSMRCREHGHQTGRNFILPAEVQLEVIWVNVGWAKMTVNTTTYKGQPCLQTDLLSFTKPSIDKFFKMRDTLTCITTEKLEPLYFRKGAEEGKRYTVDEVNFPTATENVSSTSSAV